MVVVAALVLCLESDKDLSLSRPQTPIAPISPLFNPPPTTAYPQNINKVEESAILYCLANYPDYFHNTPHPRDMKKVEEILLLHCKTCHPNSILHCVIYSVRQHVFKKSETLQYQ